MARKFKSWLQGLRAYSEDTESPRQFWEWAGLSTIASALQRKVWLPFGLETIYPNLYIMLTGPPASRKGAPVAFSKKILTELGLTVAVDSSSKRAFTMELAEAGKKEVYVDPETGLTNHQCAISVISKELSSLLAVNPKEMIEVLTDLYDCHEVWDYKTRGQDEDRLFNVCVNCLLASTPSWVAGNLPEEAIGGGYTSRHAIIYGDKVYKRVTLQLRTERQERIYRDLVSDLSHISRLVGEFTFEGGLGDKAYQRLDHWYQRIDKKLRDTVDERLLPFIGRMHSMVLKVAMCLTVDTQDELVFTAPIIEDAIERLEWVLSTASEAFGGHGRNQTGADTKRVIDHVKLCKTTTFRELLRINFRHLNKTGLREVLETIEAMGVIEWGDRGEIKYIGKKGVKYG